MPIHCLSFENINQLNIEMYRNLISTLSDTVETDLSVFKRHLSVQLSCPCLYIYVTPSLDDPKGAVTLLVEPKSIHCGASVGHLEDLVVDPQSRGLGLGNDLVRCAIHKATIEGCYKVMLHCTTFLCPFYEKNGFYSNEKTQGMRHDIIIP